MRALGALALAGLAGCAGIAARTGEWTKPGITAAAQRHDEYECERQAVMRRETAADVAAAVFADCMRARGYTRVPR